VSNEPGSVEAGKQRRGPLVLVLRVLVLVAIFSGLAFFHRPLFSSNFAVVDPGRVYRSAQPKSNLAYLLDNAQPRPASIVNLRGGSESDWWYAAEIRAASERGIDFYDVPLSAVRRPTRLELLLLLDLFDRCRYPLLIHCKSGADRTGLASGFYLMARRGVPPEQAINAFSVAHGHFPIGGPEHLHEPFIEYAAWLNSRGLSHTPALLRTWVEHDYQADDPLPEMVSVRPGPHAQSYSHRQRKATK
jgi:protein tyrosine phosphatase (PTP) superfamily phosphohydrolase (DUF442 family)